jgi:hypothetical protein
VTRGVQKRHKKKSRENPLSFQKKHSLTYVAFFFFFYGAPCCAAPRARCSALLAPGARISWQLASPQPPAPRAQGGTGTLLLRRGPRDQRRRDARSEEDERTRTHTAHSTQHTTGHRTHTPYVIRHMKHRSAMELQTPAGGNSGDKGRATIRTGVWGDEWREGRCCTSCMTRGRFRKTNIKGMPQPQAEA